jgi:tetraacyldisaccharide 4'-kinase
MKPPKFWNSTNLISLALWPVSLLYSLVSKLRYALQTPIKLDKKVICIGGVTVGGSGKTPLALAIGKLLIKHDYIIAYAYKNYGADIVEPTIVKPGMSGVCDEALLLAQVAPTVVAESRLAAVKRAAELDADIVICDDGLQNNSFVKDISILAMDSRVGFGNGMTLPAGPMRESFKSGLKKANVLCMISAGSVVNWTKGERLVMHAVPSFSLKASSKRKAKYAAFAGLACPQKFFDSLKECQISVVKTIEYPDHYQYTEQDIKDLIKQAQELNARLITTEKDMVKIPAKYHAKIDCLKMELRIMGESGLVNVVQSLF